MSSVQLDLGTIDIQNHNLQLQLGLKGVATFRPSEIYRGSAGHVSLLNDIISRRCWTLAPPNLLIRLRLSSSDPGILGHESGPFLQAFRHSLEKAQLWSQLCLHCEASIVQDLKSSTLTYSHVLQLRLRHREADEYATVSHPLAIELLANGLSQAHSQLYTIGLESIQLEAAINRFLSSNPPRRSKIGHSKDTTVQESSQHAGDHSNETNPRPIPAGNQQNEQRKGSKTRPKRKAQVAIGTNFEEADVFELFDHSFRSLICDVPLQAPAGVRVASSWPRISLSSLAPGLFSPQYISVCDKLLEVFGNQFLTGQEIENRRSLPGILARSVASVLRRSITRHLQSHKYAFGWTRGSGRDNEIQSSSEAVPSPCIQAVEQCFWRSMALGLFQPEASKSLVPMQFVRSDDSTEEDMMVSPHLPAQTLNSPAILESDEESIASNGRRSKSVMSELSLGSRFSELLGDQGTDIPLPESADTELDLALDAEGPLSDHDCMLEEAQPTSHAKEDDLLSISTASGAFVELLE